MEMNMNIRKKYTGISLNLFVFLIFTIVNLTPYLGRVTSINLNIILFLLWIVTAFFSDYHYFTKFNRVSFFTVVWIICLILMQLIGFADQAIGNLFYYLIFWFSIIVYDFYSTHLTNKQKKNIVLVILLTMTINIFSNIYELVENPSLSKLITGSVLSPELGVNSNVGVYSYVFIVNVVMITFITLFIESKSTFKKMLYLFLSVGCFYMVLLASSMIGILTGVIMIVVYIFIYTTKNNRLNKLLFFNTFIIIALLIWLFEDKFYNYFIQFAQDMDNRYLKERLLNIIHAVFGTNEQVSFSGRESLYVDSIETFVKNPLIGVGRRHTNVEGVIGLHSQILDDAAYFGIVGITIQLFILYYYYRIHIQSLIYDNLTAKSLVISITIGSVFFATFNPFINRYSGLMVFVFVPLFCHALMIKKGESEKNQIY